MVTTDVGITLTVDVAGLHKDPNNVLKYISLTDNQNDGYDNPNDKATFDTICDSNALVSWIAQDEGTGNLVIITNLKFENVPEGFFAKAPYQVGDDSWVAILGENNTEQNLECKYTIYFNDGERGDKQFTIDPKLQIRKKVS